MLDGIRKFYSARPDTRTAAFDRQFQSGHQCLKWCGSNVSLRGMRVVRNTEQNEQTDRSRNGERTSRENTNDTSRLRPSQGRSGDSRDVRDGDNHVSGQAGHNTIRRGRGRDLGSFRDGNRQ